MRFLADENFQLTSLKLLREAGHITAAVVRDSPGIKDAPVLERAVREDWIILTYDKDFYQRVYVQRVPAPPGIVQFSFRRPSRREAGERLLELLASGLQLEGFFTIVTRENFIQYPLV